VFALIKKHWHRYLFIRYYKKVCCCIERLNELLMLSGYGRQYRRNFWRGITKRYGQPLLDLLTRDYKKGV